MLWRRLEALLESSTWSSAEVLECRALASSLIGHWQSIGHWRPRSEHLVRCLWLASNKPNSTTVAVVDDGEVRRIQQIVAGCDHPQGLVVHGKGAQIPAGMEKEELKQAAPVAAIAFAALVAPPVVSWAVYRTLAARFSPLVARCSFLGLGISGAAVAAGIAGSAYSTLQRLGYQALCGVDLPTIVLVAKAILDKYARMINEGEAIAGKGGELDILSIRAVVRAEVCAQFGVTQGQMKAAMEQWQGEPEFVAAVQEGKAAVKDKDSTLIDPMWMVTGVF